MQYQSPCVQNDQIGDYDLLLQPRLESFLHRTTNDQTQALLCNDSNLDWNDLISSGSMCRN